MLRSQMRYPVAPPVLPYGTDIMSFSINKVNTVLILQLLVQEWMLVEDMAQLKEP